MRCGEKWCEDQASSASKSRLSIAIVMPLTTASIRTMGRGSEFQLPISDVLIGRTPAQPKYGDRSERGADMTRSF